MAKWREVSFGIPNTLPPQTHATFNGSTSIEEHAASSPRFVYRIATARPAGILATAAGCMSLWREVRQSASRPIEAA